MIESKTRKAAFLREAVRHLSLTKVSVEASRLEELLIRPELHEAADVVTVRAVRTEKKLLNGIQAFLRPDGLLFLFRSGNGLPDADVESGLLRLEGDHPLLPHLQSQLVVLRNVPRGTVEASFERKKEEGKRKSESR